MCIYIYIFFFFFFSFATQSDATVVLYKCGALFSGKEIFMKHVLHKYNAGSIKYLLTDLQ